MRSLIGFLVLFIAVGFSYLDAAARTPAVPAGAPQTEVEKKIHKEIRTLPYYGVFDTISFELSGGTVTLTGKVYSLGLAGTAERVVKKIAGVTSVINNIEMLPPSPFDDSIRRQMIRTFANDGGSLYRYLIEPQPSVRIIVDRGRVALEGSVATRGDYDLAGILANTVPGVFNVENNLRVEKAAR